METQVCSKCHTEKPLEEFYKRSDGTDRRHRTCRPCWNARCSEHARAYRAAHPKVPETTRKCKTCGLVKPLEEFAPHTSGYRHYCRPCFFGEMAKKTRAYRDARPGLAAQWQRNARNRKPGREAENHQARRKFVIEAYGGTPPKCACCGEREIRFLTIDHIDGTGGEHRRRVGPAGVFADLKRRGFPPGFQVLCFNCNQGKYYNGGTCPHEQGPESEEA